MIPKLSYRIDEAVQATGISRSALYIEIGKGEIATFKVGTRTLIMAAELETFLERRAYGSRRAKAAPGAKQDVRAED